MNYVVSNEHQLLLTCHRSLLTTSLQILTIQSGLRGNLKKKTSIFKDMVQIGGREVNPISKKLKEMIF